MPLPLMASKDAGHENLGKPAYMSLYLSLRAPLNFLGVLTCHKGKWPARSTA